MTPTEIRRALADLGGGANKRLGQHFLLDQATLETVVDEAHVHPGLVTLEIGPGLGVLTRALVEKGLEVIAVERDKRFVECLGRGTPGGYPISQPTRTGARPAPTIIHGDAADMDWMQVIGDREWQLVSNLPYAISSLALRKALWSSRPAENVVVLVQREVGERAITIAVNSKFEIRNSKQKHKTSLLSLMVALASSSVRIVRHVPAGAFYPPPKVESVVLQITPMPWPERFARWGIDPEKIMQVARVGFAHPRKLLVSNLKSVGAGLVPALAGQSIGQAQGLPLPEGIPEKARAEDLSPEMWAQLTKVLHQ